LQRRILVLADEVIELTIAGAFAPADGTLKEIEGAGEASPSMRRAHTGPRWICTMKPSQWASPSGRRRRARNDE
jgi:hypothetical protein